MSSIIQLNVNTKKPTRARRGMQNSLSCVRIDECRRRTAGSYTFGYSDMNSIIKEAHMNRVQRQQRMLSAREEMERFGVVRSIYDRQLLFARSERVLCGTPFSMRGSNPVMAHLEALWLTPMSKSRTHR